MSTRRSRASARDSLCCCEYESEAGDVSHILACCCDCEAFDNVCDSCMRCRPVLAADMDRLLTTVEDRCRIPGCSKQGAIRINLDKALPILLIPAGIILAASGFFMTCVVMTTLPVVLLCFYRRRTRDPERRRRTSLFYTWALVSVLQMYYTFQFIVLAFREILFWENLLLSGMFAGMMLSLFFIRRDPGVVRRDAPFGSSPSPNVQLHGGGGGGGEPAHTGVTDRDDHGGGPGSGERPSRDTNPTDFEAHLDTFLGRTPLNPPVRFDQDAPPRSGSQGAPDTGGASSSWCQVCNLQKPARAGHCPVCSVCIQGRDHHCVWVDMCIGECNHRAFFLGLLLAVLCGCYGTHLTLTTVCTPEMVFDFFLVPSDCNFVYSNYMAALGYVSAVYTSLATCGLVLMLALQVVAISQNVTQQELHRQRQRGQVTCGFLLRHNPNSRGFVRNWRDFWAGRRQRNLVYGTMIL